jgi:hypothetical protein
MTPTLTETTLIAIPLGCVIARHLYSWKLARTHLETWAISNGFSLLSAQLCHFNYGPFFSNSGLGHLVYQIKVLDQENLPRTGHIRIGTWLHGAYGNQVAIVWDDQPGQIQSKGH